MSESGEQLGIKDDSAFFNLPAIPKHFRLGNLIQINGSIQEVQSINQLEINGRRIDLKDEEVPTELVVQPVIVTRQLLYDYDFRLSTIQKGQLQHKSGFMLISEDHRIITIPTLKITFVLQPPFFHSIQNVFFYLSGRELERKKLIIS